MLLLTLLPGASALAATGGPTVTLTGSSITSTVGGTVTYTAAASNITNPEYQFWVEEPNGSWVEGTSWQSSPNFTLTTSQSGNYLVSVNALSESQIKAGDWSASVSPTNGSDGVFVNSSVNLAVNSTNVQPGHTITVTATASNIYDPQYQFWWQNPVTGNWHGTSYMAANNPNGSYTYSFTAPAAGTYRMIAYAKSPLAVNDLEGAIWSNVVSPSAYGTASVVSLTSAATTIAANGTATDAMSVSVTDANGDFVPNQTVTLSSTNPAALSVPASVTTNAVGTATFTATAGLLVGSATVTASASGASSSVTLTTTAATNSYDELAITGAPLTDIAANTPVALTAVPETSAGQTITANLGSATWSVSPTIGAKLVTAGNTAILQPSSPGTYVVTATLDGISQSQKVVVYGAPATVTLSAPASTMLADGQATDNVTLTVLDANDNPVPNQSVTLSSSDPNAVSVPASVTTNASGIATFTASAGLMADTAVIKAVAGNATGTLSLTTQAGTGTFVKLGISGAPSSEIPENTSVTLMAVPENSAGAALTGISGTPSWTITPTTGASLVADGNAAEVNATSAGTYTVTATLDGISQSQTMTVYGPPQSVALNGASTMAANGVATETVTATVTDANGNNVPNQVVTLSSSNSNVVSVPATATTNTSGVASFTASAGVIAGGATITATAGSATGTLALTTTSTSATFTQLAITGAPVPDVGENVPVALTAVPENSAGVALTANIGSANWSVSPSSGASLATGGNTAILTASSAGTYTVTASLDGITTSQQVVVFGAVSQTKSSLISSATSVVAGTPLNYTLSLEDANGNPIVGQATNIYPTLLSGTAATVSYGTVTESSPGTYTFTATDTTAESMTVGAVFSGTTITAPTVTVTAGSISSTKSSLTPSTTSTVAGTPVTYTVLLADQYGNPITSQAGDIAIGVASGTSADVKLSTVTGTSTPGLYTFTATDTKAESLTISATDNGVTLDASPVTMNVGPVSSLTSTLTSPTTSVAAGTPVTYTLNLEDANGNFITGQAANITLGLVSGTAADVHFSSPIKESASNPGTYTFSADDTKAQSMTVDATYSGTTIDGPVVSVTAGAVSAAMSSLTPSATTTVAGTALTYTLMLEDQYGNPITGQASNIIPSVITGTSADVTLGGVTESSTTPGTYTFTAMDTKAESLTIGATYDMLTMDAGPVTVNPDVSAVSNITPTVSGKGEVTIGWTDPTSGTASGYQIWAIPSVSGELINNTATTSTTPVLVETINGGQATSGVVSGLTPGGTYEFNVDAVDPYGNVVKGTLTAPFTVAGAVYTMTQSSPTSPETAGSIYDVTLTAADQYGNPVSGFQTVTLSSSENSVLATSSNGTAAEIGSSATSLANYSSAAPTITLNFSDGQSTLYYMPVSATTTGTLEAAIGSASATQATGIVVNSALSVTAITMNITVKSGSYPSGSSTTDPYSTSISATGSGYNWALAIDQDTATTASSADFVSPNTTVTMANALTSQSPIAVSIAGTGITGTASYGQLAWSGSGNTWTLTPNVAPQTFETSGTWTLTGTIQDSYGNAVQVIVTLTVGPTTAN